MSDHLKKSLCALGLALTCTGSCYALSLGGSMPIDVNGFMTIGGGFNTSSQGYMQPEAGTLEHHFKPNNSLIGLQATAHLQPKLSFTTQFVGRYDNSFEADANWAFLKYQATPSLTTSLGRFRLPIFMYSDTYQVGHTYLWVLPPSEMYFMVPFYNINGVRATFSHHAFGDWNTKATLSYGFDKKKLTIPLGPAYFYGKNIVDANVSLTNNQWTFYGTAMWLKFKLDQLPQFKPSVYGPQDNQIAKFIGLGARYEGNHLLMSSELGQRFLTGTLPSYMGGYASVGYRIHQWTPGITVAFMRTKKNSQREQLFQNSNDIFNIDQNSITLDLRYAINNYSDFKVEAQRVYLLGDSFGFFDGFKDGDKLTGAKPPKSPVMVFRMAYDLSF